MEVHKDLDRLPKFRKAVITIGTFDGVHLGHRQIIERLKIVAAEVGGESVIITFHPHPRKIVASASTGIRLINTLEEKTLLLEALGVDHLVVVPFTDAFANQDAADYVKDFLVQRFHPHTIIIGYDHRFGKERKGGFELLQGLANKYDYRLEEIPKHVLDEIAISSTAIRNAVLQGNTDIAEKLLGYEFFFSGRVIHGEKLGRQLGYPTANLEILNEEKLVPGDGIYAVYAEVLPADNGVEKVPILKGMMSIGMRPTVNGKYRAIEVNLFDFASDIYDHTLRIHVRKYLRPEVKFDSLDELVKQIDKDKEESLKVL